MKPRILILPLSALIIIALVTWRLQREAPQPTVGESSPAARLLAPRFELYDQHSRLVKLDRYLGRTRLLILFFDGQSPPDENVWLIRLRDDFQTLKEAGIDVLAVSSATPFAIREAEQRSGAEFPFPVLTDIDRHSPIPVPAHRLWGLANDESGETRSGLFFVDRDGSVASINGAPAPLENSDAIVNELLQSRH